MEKSFKKQKDKLSIFKNLRQRDRKNKNTREIPEDLFKKCPNCGEIQTSASYKDNVCPNCGFHLPLNAYQRMDLVFDGRYKVMFTTKEAPNPLDFPGYSDKIAELKQSTDLDEAVVCSVGHIGKIRCVVCVMDNRFMMGSMGSVVGEKITKSVEYALKKKLPLIIFTTSGGARMQEGDLLFDADGQNKRRFGKVQGSQLIICFLHHSSHLWWRIGIVCSSRRYRYW